MPNKYTRKTDRGTASVEIYDLAFKEVRLRAKSLRDAAASQNLNYMSLSTYIKKKDAYQANPEGEALSMGYTIPTILTEEEENILSDYLLTCATISKVFSAESVRPLTRAPPRKNNQPNRRKVKSAVFIDTPTKDEIAAIKANRKTKNVKKSVLSEGKKKPKKAKETNEKKKTIDDEEAENDCFCLICLEAFADSRSKEQWAQCLECKGWAHVDCTGDELQYVCHNCESD